ncbi:Type II secretion system protein F [Rubripirellula amarantea]|uniref:Type II secretion system protein F n=1 Tax=Rubripirellula amarantea TaxID=2527999 RepID=A0A5C5WRA6_9BACT|nr:type II secretion system F family protein [Rubripirellula amarantea]TWT52709.1 Type II secretion system protein F [Rubripirellula amarantea]
MAVFSYTGTDRTQATVRGTIAADTPRQARDQLRAEGVRVRKLVTCATEQARGWRPRFSLTSTKAAWATAVHELAMMLHAGIPMLDALDTLAEQNTGSFQAAILNVRDQVSAGVSLAEALAKRPDLFDAASVHMVEVGENSGTLDTVLTQLADFKRRQLGLRDSVTTAMVYPLFLVFFGGAAGLFLMTWVLPPLLENLQETMDVLPWPTRVAKAMSDLLLSYGWLLAIVALVCVAATVMVLRTPKGKRALHRAILKLPIIGPMAIKQGVSRIAMIIATLSRSGVELTRAVELAGRSTDNLVFRDALEQCEQRIAAGEEVSDALRQSEAFPPLAIRVFSVGQESGKLDEMLFRLAEDYDSQVATSSARLTALIEPALILVLAAMVGFLLLATILPILEAGNVM